MLDLRAPGVTANNFAKNLLEAKQIAVMPGERFSAAAAGPLRVAMTVEDRLFEKALTRLCRFASERAVRAA